MRVRMAMDCIVTNHAGGSGSKWLLQYERVFHWDLVMRHQGWSLAGCVKGSTRHFVGEQVFLGEDQSVVRDSSKSLVQGRGLRFSR